MTTGERLERVQRALEKEERAKMDRKIAKIEAILKIHRISPDTDDEWIARKMFEIMEDRRWIKQ